MLATLLACNFSCKQCVSQLKLHTVPSQLKVSKDAERRLRVVIAQEFRRMAAKYGSEQQAANALGITRQRFKKYLDRQMTPKADVLLVAMANWELSILHEGARFTAKKKTPKVRPRPAEQLTLNYFDEPQVLHDDQRNVEVRVSRKQTDTLRFAVEVRLAG
jgi:hypothetical protein